MQRAVKAAIDRHEHRRDLHHDGRACDGVEERRRSREHRHTRAGGVEGTAGGRSVAQGRVRRPRGHALARGQAADRVPRVGTPARGAVAPRAPGPCESRHPALIARQKSVSSKKQQV
jgi:hypothetical protein